MIFRPYFRIATKEEMAQAVEKFPVLPFFPNNVRGLSIQEMCAPGMLFGGNYDEGCWEWKGPVIRKRTVAYGKFFNRKAGFISLQVLPEFLNYRRKAYPIKPDSTEEMLLEIIKENDSLTSTELKKLIFGEYKRESWDELPEASKPSPGHRPDFIDPEGEGLRGSQDKPRKKKSLEGPLQRLQMAGRIIISDFEYKRTRNGERYGWGVARYSTPEVVFGSSLKIPDEDSSQSLDSIITTLKKLFPLVSSSSLRSLLK